MILFKKAIDLRKYLDIQREKDVKIGFVPTMGALHEGHLSLVRQALEGNNIVVCSIFINPTQFNDPADYQKYPVSLEQDLLQLETSGCHLVFLPSVEEIYPLGTDENVHYDLGYLESILEGKYRPGHFQGVCRVVHRLLDIVKPDHLYLGQKDYQQCMVIARLTALTGMDKTLSIRVAPTLREKSGLAMSSRNMRLDAAARKKAAAIQEALQTISSKIKTGNLGPLKDEAVAFLAANGFKPDYVEIADANTLETVTQWDGKQKIVALAAAFLGEVRLIDNILLN